MTECALWIIGKVDLKTVLPSTMHTVDDARRRQTVVCGEYITLARDLAGLAPDIDLDGGNEQFAPRA